MPVAVAHCDIVVSIDLDSKTGTIRIPANYLGDGPDSDIAEVESTESGAIEVTEACVKAVDKQRTTDA